MQSDNACKNSGEVRHLRKILGATAAVAAIACASQARAEDGSSNAATQPAVAVETVIVTATKRNENVQNVPMTVEALTATDLNNNQIDGLRQMAQSLPNVVAASAAGQDNADYFLRGVGTFAYNPGTSSAVSFYQDQFYLNSTILKSEPYFDIERVEVLFGPQGTLWGQNSTGGAVSVITRKPTNEFDGYGSLTYGANNELDVEGAVGGALVSDQLSARIAFTRQSSDGWVHNDFNGATLGKYTDSAVRVQFLWTPTDNFSALLKVNARTLTSDGTLYRDFGIGPGGLDITGFTSANLPPNRIDSFLSNPADDSRARGVSLTMNWDIGFADLTALTSYHSGDNEWRFNDTGGPAALEVGHYQATAQQENFELRLTSKTDQTLTWIAGVAYYDDIESGHQQFYSPDFNPISYGPYGYAVQYRQNTRNAAVFGSLTWEFLPRWSITAGGRYTVEWLADNLNNGAYLINPAAPETPQASPDPFISYAVQQATERSSEPTGGVTLQYEPTSELNFYAKVSRGYRGGGFAAGTFAAPSVVSPEYVWAYEVGAKSSWLDGQLILNGALFKYDFTNLQINDVEGFVAILKNAGIGHYEGGDLFAEYKPSVNSQVGVKYGITNSNVYNYNTTGPDGNTYFIAKNSQTFQSASFFGSYTFDLSDKGNIELYLEGDRRPQQAAYPVRLADPNYSIFYKVPAYWLANARLTYTPPNSHWELAVWATNIANTQQIEFPANYYYLGLASGQYSEPRRFGITVSSKF